MSTGYSESRNAIMKRLIVGVPDQQESEAVVSCHETNAVGLQSAKIIAFALAARRQSQCFCAENVRRVLVRGRNNAVDFKRRINRWMPSFLAFYWVFVPRHEFTERAADHERLDSKISPGHLRWRPTHELFVNARICRTLGIDEKDPCVRSKANLAAQGRIGSNFQQPARPTPPLSPATTAGSPAPGLAKRFMTPMASSSSTIIKASAARERIRQATSEGS